MQRAASSKTHRGRSSHRIYRACPIKRPRRTGDDIIAIKNAIKEVLEGDHPQTVRQVFYQLVTRDVIEKSEKEYQQVVIRLLTEMRLSGEVSFAWIIDSSRTTHETQTFDSIADAVADTARFYRRSALRESDAYVEIWVEKEALAGIIWDVAGDYDVPVVVSKGMPSLTQLHGSFQNVYRAADAGKGCFIYQFGDHDPTGALIPKVIESRMQWFCERTDCTMPTVERYALTKEQIEQYDLPTRPTKRFGNSHAASFEGESVELDALPSNVLRELVSDCIEQHISSHDVTILREAEESERELLKRWAKRATKAALP
ncbi:MAG: hypothetical protein ACLPKT_22105 [Methylocella sp.]